MEEAFIWGLAIETLTTMIKNLIQEVVKIIQKIF